jgi:hypothetical protein
MALIEASNTAAVLNPTNGITGDNGTSLFNPTSQTGGSRVIYLHIDDSGNFFDTREQIKSKNIQWFVETTTASRISGSNAVSGLFSRKAVQKDDVVYNSDIYPTGSTITDPSGAERKILSIAIDYYASSSIDGYRNGIEITQDKHWTAGTAKITAGTPGHLYVSTEYGYSANSIISKDRFVEVDVFDPVKYVFTGGDPEKFTYPIITADYNLVENYVLNGIIEPFPIRPVVSNFSLNFPFEPHSVKGFFEGGNTNSTFATDSIVTVDYHTPDVQCNAPFLDAVDSAAISTGVDGGSVRVGQPIGYLSMDTNKVRPYDDIVYPRGVIPSSSYDASMLSALSHTTLAGETYVNRKQRSATSGFVYDENNYLGTDSIAFGGMLY